MARNSFSCLSNTVLCAGLQHTPTVAYALPQALRSAFEGQDPPALADILAVTLTQLPQAKGTFITYVLSVHMHDGSLHARVFRGCGFDKHVDFFTLYDQARDGVLQHLHLQQ